MDRHGRDRPARRGLRALHRLVSRSDVWKPHTITLEQQEGRRFAGTRASARATDPLIGMMGSDGKRLHMVDNDGTLTGELLGSDEMEVCRTEVTPQSMIVSCGTFTRER